MWFLSTQISGSLNLYLFLLPFLGLLFVLSDSKVLVFVLLYYILFYSYSFEATCYLVRDGKGGDSDGKRSGKKLGEVERGENVIRM